MYVSYKALMRLITSEIIMFKLFYFPVLQISKDDVTALHCKVVCLIQNGSFKEALSVINTHSKVLSR